MSDPHVAYPETPAGLRELAEQAARVGGRVACAAFGTENRVRLKSDRSEVTDADLAAERAVIELLRAARPHDAFLAEEQTGVAGFQPGGAGLQPVHPARICWVIDPIDGTRNFIRGVPWFATCVAAVSGGWPIAGAIYDPLRDVCYTAQRGEGAWESGRPLKLASLPPVQTDEAPALPPAAAQTGRHPRPLVAIPSTRHEAARTLVLRSLDEFVVRNLGSSALHLALVAAGRLDGALLTGCKLWDIAAGWLVVTESGGRMTRLDGSELFPVDVAGYSGAEMPCVAATAWLHSRLLQEGQNAILHGGSG
jgi:myo-inositol-1(or 4)-monophosphatase